MQTLHGRQPVSAATDDRRLLDRIVHPYPPRGYRPERYDRWFPKTGSAMQRSLKRSAAERADGRWPVPADAGTAVVVVTPWVSTPVPWYSVMLGIGLRRRRPLVFVWDDTGFPQPALESQQHAIGDVLSSIGPNAPVVRLSEQRPTAGRPGDDELIESLTRQNVIWALRGGEPGPADDGLDESIRGRVARTLPLVRATLTEIRPEMLVVPGGVGQTSGLFLGVAAELDCRAATFDVDRGIAQVAAMGVAAQCGDLPPAFHTLWNRRTTSGRRRSTWRAPSSPVAPTARIATGTRSSLRAPT